MEGTGSRRNRRKEEKGKGDVKKGDKRGKEKGKNEGESRGRKKKLRGERGSKGRWEE